jgi:hypothetical protein
VQLLLSELVMLQKIKKQFPDVMVFLRNLTYPVASYIKEHSPVGTTLADNLQLESGRALIQARLV